MKSKLTTTIEKIKEVLNRNHYDKTSNQFNKPEYDIQIDEDDAYWFIHIYMMYIDFKTLDDLSKNNINVLTIWADEHEFYYTVNEKIPCIKTTVAIPKCKINTHHYEKNI